MKDNCLDIGLIQAFLDGELETREVSRVSDHIESCDQCALMLADAEEESAVVFPVLEREFNSLVPTQRLWKRINASIEVEKQSMPIWQKAWAFITVSFVNPSYAVAAGLIIVAGIFAAVWMSRTNAPTDVARSPGKSAATVSIPAPVVSSTNNKQVDTPPVPTVERAAYRPENRRVVMAPAVVKATVNANSSAYMPGEESYVRTISTLSKSVDEQKSDGIMRPSERVDYERDMAVVDDTIAKMRKEVKRNPTNESAKQVLYSSYQNKIDLLNSVAQKEELIASIR